MTGFEIGDDWQIFAAAEDVALAGEHNFLLLAEPIKDANGLPELDANGNPKFRVWARLDGIKLTHTDRMAVGETRFDENGEVVGGLGLRLPNDSMDWVKIPNIRDRTSTETWEGFARSAKRHDLQHKYAEVPTGRAGIDIKQGPRNPLGAGTRQRPEATYNSNSAFATMLMENGYDAQECPFLFGTGFFSSARRRPESLSHCRHAEGAMEHAPSRRRSVIRASAGVIQQQIEHETGRSLTKSRKTEEARSTLTPTSKVG